jgi:hypothetical protein
VQLAKMERSDIVLQGKFCIPKKPGKVYLVELTSERLRFQDVNLKDADWEGVVDLRDVIGCRITGEMGTRQDDKKGCNCVHSNTVSDTAECHLSVYSCPKRKKKFRNSYYRQHLTLTLALSQYTDYNANKVMCEKWRKTILSFSNNNNNDLALKTGTIAYLPQS